MTSSDAGAFLRNPDFQLRDFGACSPKVSLSRNLLSSRSRHPKIVTGSDFEVAFADASAGAFTAVASVASVLAMTASAEDALVARVFFGWPGAGAAGLTSALVISSVSEG